MWSGTTDIFATLYKHLGNDKQSGKISEIYKTYRNNGNHKSEGNIRQDNNLAYRKVKQQKEQTNFVRNRRNRQDLNCGSNQRSKGQQRRSFLTVRRMQRNNKRNREESGDEMKSKYKRRLLSQKRRATNTYNNSWDKGDKLGFIKFPNKVDIIELESLYEKSPLDTIMWLESKYKEFESLLQNTGIKPCMLTVILKVLSNICSTDLVHLKASVLSAACKPNFIAELKKYIVVELPKECQRKEHVLSFCQNCLTFFSTVTKLFSVSIYNAAKIVLVSLLSVMSEIGEVFQGNMAFQNILDELKILTEQVKTADLTMFSNNKEENKITHVYESSFNQNSNFRTISHIPTFEELLTC